MLGRPAFWRMRLRRQLMRTLPLFGLFLLLSAPVSAEVKAVKTPHGGIQPQAVVDAKGTLHLIYFKGDAAAGDLFYVRQDAGKFGTPVRVNSVPGSAVAVRSVRGGQVALGKD